MTLNEWFWSGHDFDECIGFDRSGNEIHYTTGNCLEACKVLKVESADSLHLVANVYLDIDMNNPEWVNLIG